MDFFGGGGVKFSIIELPVLTQASPFCGSLVCIEITTAQQTAMLNVSENEKFKICHETVNFCYFSSRNQSVMYKTMQDLFARTNNEANI